MVLLPGSRPSIRRASAVLVETGGGAAALLGVALLLALGIGRLLRVVLLALGIALGSGCCSSKRGDDDDDLWSLRSDDDDDDDLWSGR